MIRMFMIIKMPCLLSIIHINLTIYLLTLARLVITLTVTAVTPISLPTPLSIRIAQLAQDMPAIRDRQVMKRVNDENDDIV